MGFCRRCGDIVSGERCKCGGTAVAPVLSWKEHGTEDQDKWSKTYVLKDHSTPSTSNMPVKRYSKNMPTSATTNISARISAHIASATSSSSHIAPPLRATQTGPIPEAGILPSPCDSTLAKVYGSVLQPTESLAAFFCVICNTTFPPDATIYPDPRIPDAASENQFLCRPCFVANGGSKGNCPSCSRPVLTLKSEGGFIHAANQYWHKRCFNCDGCQKNIGDAPMVDLLGRPSCSDCFDSCLRRDREYERGPRTPTRRIQPNFNAAAAQKNLGGMDTALSSTVAGLGLRSREASPGLQELEQRLGIARTTTREGSPSLEELSQRLSSIGKDPLRARRDSTHSDRYQSPEPEDFAGSPERSNVLRISTGAPSPIRRQVTGTSRSGSPAPTPEAIEEMKSRFIKPTSTPQTTSPLNHLAQSFTTSSILTVSRSPTLTRTNLGSRLPVPTVQSQSQHNADFKPQGGNPSNSSPSLSPLDSKTLDLVSDLYHDTAQSPLSNMGSPPQKEARNDLESEHVNLANMRSSGNDLEKNIGSGAIGTIVEETESQLTSPIHTPTKRADQRVTPTSRIPVASRSPNARMPTSGSPTTMPQGHESVALSRCARCNGLLFNAGGGCNYLTVPAEEGTKAKAYHVECFRCTVCGAVFKESGKGQAPFVKANGGPCHIECAPPERHVVRESISTSELRPNYAESATVNGSTPDALKPTNSPGGNTINVPSSSRYERPTPSATKYISTDLVCEGSPRFGSRSACPGCNTFVSPMERGVVPGPQGTRWHAACLVCGGKRKKDADVQQKSALWIVGRGGGGGGGSKDRRKNGEPGCGKKLDSAAKTDGEGGVWCRECLLMLTSLPSPTKPLIPPASAKGVPAQNTGTTLARQFTGIGGVGDAGILRQLTGGGLSPTRSISPTKQLSGGMNATGRPRPKSVIGMRSAKSVDEGRGMFLVRQMTGSR